MKNRRWLLIVLAFVVMLLAAAAVLLITAGSARSAGEALLTGAASADAGELHEVIVSITGYGSEEGRGTVTVEPQRATAGTEIIIRPQPDPGYRVGTVYFSAIHHVEPGEPMPSGTGIAQNNGNGTYSVIMPDLDLNVTVSFVKHVACPSEVFSDVDPNRWYHQYIDCALDSGLMRGVSDTSFEPNGTTTRGMIVTMLHRMSGEPDVVIASPFSDVSGREWYGDAVRWAFVNGIVEGYDDGRFGATDSITREQFAAILYRYAQYLGLDVSKSITLYIFADEGSVSPWARRALEWTNGVGLITGRSSDTLAPMAGATRAEAAAIITGFIDRYDYAMFGEW